MRRVARRDDDAVHIPRRDEFLGRARFRARHSRCDHSSTFQVDVSDGTDLCPGNRRGDGLDMIGPHDPCANTPMPRFMVASCLKHLYPWLQLKRRLDGP